MKRILARASAAVLANYAFCALLVALGSLALPSFTDISRGEAVLLSSMLGFAVYITGLIWAFSGVESGFRRSMSWLHTWTGVGLGGLLLTVFWMGSLTVFDHEIDRWMMPETRRLQVPADLSLDAAVRPAAERFASRSPNWVALLPDERNPTVRLRWRDASGRDVVRHIDPATGAELGAGTRGGTGFIYPFHYRLNIVFKDLGAWLAGLAAVAMLAGIVTGLTHHRRKLSGRPALNLHNFAGLLVAPFCFFMAFSGLIIGLATYFPSGWKAAFAGDNKAFRQDAYGIYTRQKAGAPGKLSSLDAMVKEAKRIWGDGRPYYVRVWHPGDANSYVEVRRLFDDRIAWDSIYLFFDGASGSLIARAGEKPVRKAQRFITGLHMLGFKNWALRWLYFLGGLTGCALIATGFILWLEKRRTQHERNGSVGARLIQAVAVGIFPGLMLATAAFFAANRILPRRTIFLGVEREVLEMSAFYLAWVLAFAHGAWRGRAAWAGQCRALAGTALAAVILNWTTTGDHLLLTLRGGLYAVAGMDVLLISGGTAAALAARRLSKQNTHEEEENDLKKKFREGASGLRPSVRGLGAEFPGSLRLD